METGHGFRGGETEAQTLRQNVAANEGQGGQAQVGPSVCNSDLIRKSSLSTILWRFNKSL